MMAAAQVRYEAQVGILMERAHLIRLFLGDERWRGERCAGELTGLAGPWHQVGWSDSHQADRSNRWTNRRTK